jgi:acyl dehydratase
LVNHAGGRTVLYTHSKTGAQRPFLAIDFVGVPRAPSLRFRSASAMPFRYFDDFREDEVIDLGHYRVTAEEIIDFASKFDPAPFHLDEAAGKASMLGGLAASGWHTCAMMMKMMCDSFLLESSGQGAPGIDECRWLAPVLAGDTINARATVLAKRASASRPGLGIVRFRFDVEKQGPTPVMTVENAIIFRIREKTEGGAA